jgi:arylsulfatase A-like enzyme
LKSHQPFYAQVNFPETHRGEAWDNAHEHIEVRADPNRVRLPPYYPDYPEARDDWAQYLNTVMSLDRKIGFVMELLKRDGLAERTVVIFMGDHGRAMVRGKQWPYDSGLHVPLLIRWPNRFAAPEAFKAGGVEKELIASIDVAATTLAIAGVQPPLMMQGRVFLGESRAPPRRYLFGGRDRGDETVDRIRTVRDARYRYLRNFYPGRPFLQLNRYKEFTYPMIPLMRELHAEGKLTPVQARLLAPTRPEEELYDLEEDPYEINNLAEDPAYRDRLREMRLVLDAWILESNDQGRIPEPPEIPAFWERRMSENYDARIKDMLEERRKKTGR